eukprot:SAG11_NODE_24454_length_373_cov_0.645985_1_plen_117_part_01
MLGCALVPMKMGAHRVVAVLALFCGRANGDGTCSAARLNGTSFHGDLHTRKDVASAGDCCNACASTARCAIWTLSASGCYLRANGVQPFSNPGAQSGYTSAAKPVPHPAPPAPPTPP